VSGYVGKKLTAAQVAQYAYQAGFRGESLIIAVAISHAETAEAPFDTAARGDVGLETEKYGASIGLWQIRSLRADTGTGRLRDELANLDPATNARHAYAISKGGTDFGPWSTYVPSPKHPKNNSAYKAFMAEARSAAGSAASGVTASGAAASVDGGTPILAIVGGSSGPQLPLTIGGRPAVGELGEAIVGGQVDFSVNAISELTVELSDPGYVLHRRFRLEPDGTLHLFALPYRIVEYRLKQGPGAPHVTLVAQPEGVVRMTENSPAARTDVTPTVYMQQVAAAAGLKFVGEASAVVASVGPAQVPDMRSSGLLMSVSSNVATRPETAWEVGQRLAGVLGFYAFEAAGTYYFASAHYLQTIGQQVQISTDGQTFGASAGPVFHAMGLPTAAITKRELDPVSKKLATASTYPTVDANFMNVNLSGTVEHDTGINLRPVMRARWTGVGPILTGLSVMVTRVSWNLADFTSPVSVETGSLAAKSASGRTAQDDAASTYGTSGTAGSTIRVIGAKPTVLDLVTQCLRQVGNKYTWGGEDPKGGFDCSGLIQWAAHDLGVSLPRTADTQFAAVRAAGLTMSIAQAMRTRGAVLYRAKGAEFGLGAHIVISLGNGVHTIEARGAAYGVVAHDDTAIHRDKDGKDDALITGRTWTGAGKLPGFTY
jgi:cell wall-associated NlpC family hydrolase